MQLLESYDEYKDMIREFREKCRKPFSNIYYVPDDMERYIQLGRVNYRKHDKGIKRIQGWILNSNEPSLKYHKIWVLSLQVNMQMNGFLNDFILEGMVGL